MEADNCFVYMRETDEARCLIALNFAAEARPVTIHGEGRGAIVLSTHLDREEQVTLTSFTLRPYEGVIIEVEEQGLMEEIELSVMHHAADPAQTARASYSRCWISLKSHGARAGSSAVPGLGHGQP